MIGVQRVDDSVVGNVYNDFSWYRVTLTEAFIPETEGALRLPTPQEKLLDTLFRDHSDPKAPPLLERAQKIDRHYQQARTRD